MKQTPNLSLKKPELTDVVNIEDLNQNFDTIDTEIKGAKDKADQAFQSASNRDADTLDGKHATDFFPQFGVESVTWDTNVLGKNGLYKGAFLNHPSKFNLYDNQGTLIVLEYNSGINNSGWARQLFVSAHAEQLFIRNSRNGTWSEWTRLASIDDLKVYLPLSGGEMSGSITTPYEQGFKSKSSQGYEYRLVYLGGDSRIYLASAQLGTTIQSNGAIENLRENGVRYTILETHNSSKIKVQSTAPATDTIWMF